VIANIVKNCQWQNASHAYFSKFLLAFIMLCRWCLQVIELCATCDLKSIELYFLLAFGGICHSLLFVLVYSP